MHLREHEGLTCILVGNDLAVISPLCDRAALQRALNAAACLYFTTVLSPGSDETTATTCISTR